MVGGRGRAIVSGCAGAVGFMAMLRVRDGMTRLIRGVIFMRDDARLIRRSRSGHGARRNTGREISNGERRDDIARRPALPASQPRENVRSIVHGSDSTHHCRRRRNLKQVAENLNVYKRVLRSRSALPPTDTDERLIARLAMIGDNNRPKIG